jgi:hypothetical protein
MVRIRASAWGTNELVALFLLVGGAVLLPVLGPLIGLIVVARSRVWTRREKAVTLGCVLTAFLLPLLVLLVGAAFGRSLSAARVGDAAFLSAALTTVAAFAAGGFLALRLKARPIP